MPEYTPTHGIAFPEALDPALPESRDFQRLAQTTDAALTTVRGQAIEAWATNAATTGQNADTLTTEGYYASVSGAVIANLPAESASVAGILTTRKVSATTLAQTWLTTGSNPELWTRFRGSVNWSAWTRLDAGTMTAPTGLDANSITRDSRYVIINLTAAVNLPSDLTAGILETVVLTSSTRLQTWITTGSAPEFWTRFSGSGGWSGWTRLDAGGVEPSTGGAGDSPSALKTLPVALTASGVTTTEAVAAGALRFLLNINAPITRWRLHVRNYNDRFDTEYTAGASFTGLWVGPRGVGAAFSTAPTQVSGPFTLPAGGDDYVTPWSSVPLGDGVDHLISLGWTGAGGPNTTSPGGGYRSTNSGAGGATSGAGFSAAGFFPFSWWLEVETLATTPAVAMWGDSITAGTGNTFVLHDSPLSQYCRRIGAVPVHYAYPGTAMSTWTNPNSRQWTRWADLSRVDAVIHFMGQNDLNSAGTLTAMQDRFTAALSTLGARVSQNIYVATITPTSTKTPEINTVRKNYNNWLKTLPLGVRDCFDFSAAVANAADDALAPYADSGDALHLSTAGSTALALAITRPVTSTGGLDATAALDAYLATIN